MDPSKVDFWAHADVLVTEDLDADVPQTALQQFSADWALVGILDGEEGFTTSREEEATKHYGWGVYIGERFRNYSESRSFTALENNETTRRLMYPGSPAGGIAPPDRSKKYKFAFEKREGNRIHRLITANYATCTIDGDTTENETDPTSVTFVTTPVIDPETELFYIEQDSDAEGAVVSLSITPATATIDIEEIIKLTATGTREDSSTVDLSTSVSWTAASGAVSIAPGGFITGVSAETVEVSATFGDLTGTAEITVV